MATTAATPRFAPGARVALPAERVDPGGEPVEGLTGVIVAAHSCQGDGDGQYWVVQLDANDSRLIYAENELQPHGWTELEEAEAVKHRCPGCGVAKIAVDEPGMGVLLVCVNPTCEYDK